MKTYINKTRFQKRIVFVDEKTGKTDTVFLRSGQKVERKEAVKSIEDGIKVREEVKKTTSKKVENSEGKE